MTKKIITHLTKDDAILDDIYKKVILPDHTSTQNVFHDLMSCIIEQQIHYRSSKKMFQKMMNEASLNRLTLDNFSELEEKGLKDKKLSTRKYETILGTLDFFENNNINWSQLSDDEVRTQLSQIKGIGPWTIDMILLYTLERENVFPADDYHLRLIMTKLYDIDTSARVKAQQKEIAKNWEPYCSVAVRYLLAWKSFC